MKRENPIQAPTTDELQKRVDESYQLTIPRDPILAWMACAGGFKAWTRFGVYEILAQGDKLWEVSLCGRDGTPLDDSFNDESPNFSDHGKCMLQCEADHAKRCRSL